MLHGSVECDAPRPAARRPMHPPYTPRAYARADGGLPGARGLPCGGVPCGEWSGEPLGRSALRASKRSPGSFRPCGGTGPSPPYIRAGRRGVVRGRGGAVRGVIRRTAQAVRASGVETIPRIVPSLRDPPFAPEQMRRQMGTMRGGDIVLRQRSSRGARTKGAGPQHVVPRVSNSSVSGFHRPRVARSASSGVPEDTSPSYAAGGTVRPVQAFRKGLDLPLRTFHELRATLLHPDRRLKNCPVVMHLKNKSKRPPYNVRDA